MIVITLSRVPAALRGDLTKWYQEIQTGVYVGNVSARIRDNLWARILENIGSGEATIVYNAQNEFGYQFKTTRKDHEVIDFDGIPLLMHLTDASATYRPGFSDAAKFHRAHQQLKQRPAAVPNSQQRLIVLDIETTGLDPSRDEMIAIGAVKSYPDGHVEELSMLINTGHPVPTKITDLTGLSTALLAAKGSELEDVLQQLSVFVENWPIVGYNLRFDDEFLSIAYSKNGDSELTNPLIDLLPLAKRAEPFLDNYKLKTVLRHYQIENAEPHHPLSDAKATLALAQKLMKIGKLKISEDR